jgi:hypothetical protein
MKCFRAFLGAGLAEIALTATMAAATSAQAQEITLHNFGYATGKTPISGPVYDATSGAFYGATPKGGTHQRGVVYKLTPPKKAGGKWRYSVLYDNTLRRTSITVSGGVVYVSAGENDIRDSCDTKPDVSCGVIFSLTPPASGAGPWTQTVLYSFSPGTNGIQPWGRLAIDGQGALYGTAAYDGTGCVRYHGCGTAFKLSPPVARGQPWTYSVLYHFEGGAAGNNPLSGVILDKTGNLYGETEYNKSAAEGLANKFLVFRLTPPAGAGEWTETVLARFVGAAGTPYDAPLVIDSSGALYGAYSACAPGVAGCLDASPEYLFQLAPSNADPNVWTETILHKFPFDRASEVAPYLLTAPLTVDANGTVYGVTEEGGPQYGGTVFSLRPRPGHAGEWDYKSLYDFPTSTNGAFTRALPNGGLAEGPGGLLYGTTQTGGSGYEGSFFSVSK